MLLAESVQEISLDEERLVREAQQGSAEAFGALYDLWVTPVYRYMVLRVGHGAQAEDLTEETFLRALQSLLSFHWKGTGSFSAWLFRIAHNLVIDTRRRQAQRQTLPMDVAAQVPAEEPSLADTVVEGVWVREAVSSLTALQQEVVALRFWSGLSIAETAMTLGRSPGAVKALQHAALQTLRRLLVDAGGGSLPASGEEGVR